MTSTGKKGDIKPKTKKLSNPASTGAAGPSFEHRIQASRLIARCLGIPAPGTGEDRIVELKFQARIHGYHTDDLVCTIEGKDGQRRRTLLQMKRSLAACDNDKAFSESVAAAWTDYKSTTVFDKGLDSIFIIHNNASAAAARIITRPVSRMAAGVIVMIWVGVALMLLMI